MAFAKIEEALEEIKNGKMVIVVDDENRENEGDFIMAAEFITPEAINFMATIGRGLICTPISAQKARDLDLPLMVEYNNSANYTAFTVSIDARIGGTGISANDRSLTTKLLTIDATLPYDLIRPGHIFPLIAKDGGVLERAGHTEAAIDLAQLSGCSPVGVICEILNTDGTMARVNDLELIAEQYNLKLISIEDLILYRESLTEEKCQEI